MNDVANGNGVANAWESAGNWAALSGRWQTNESACRYTGHGQQEGALGLGLCLNQKRMTDGEIHAEISLTRTDRTTGGIFVGYQSLNRHYIAACIGAHDRAYSLVQFVPGYGFRSLTASGTNENLNVGSAYKLQVQFAAQRLRMRVNGVDVIDSVLDAPLEGTGWGLFAWDDAEVCFANFELRKHKPKLFVVMPFSEPFDSLYRDVIKPVAERKELDFKVDRVDEIYGPGVVLDDIRRQINEAHVVVADVSVPNPNVFYELGYAHALNKPAVLLARRSRDEVTTLPFDIRAYRVVFYDDTIGGKKRVEEELERNLRAVLHEQ